MCTMSLSLIVLSLHISGRRFASYMLCLYFIFNEYGNATHLKRRSQCVCVGSTSLVRCVTLFCIFYISLNFYKAKSIYLENSVRCFICSIINRKVEKMSNFSCQNSILYHMKCYIIISSSP